MPCCLALHSLHCMDKCPGPVQPSGREHGECGPLGRHHQPVVEPARTAYLSHSPSASRMTFTNVSPLVKLQLAEISLSGARLAAPCVPSAARAPVLCVCRSIAPQLFEFLR